MPTVCIRVVADYIATTLRKAIYLFKQKERFEYAPKPLLLLYFVGISYSFIIFLVVLPKSVWMYNK
jgi:hypothetical protein